MENDHIRTNFACFHNPDALCRKCRGRIWWFRTWAATMRADERFNFWPEEMLAKLRLIQDQTHEVIKRESQRAKPRELPLTPLRIPYCDLCGEPSDLVTPDDMAFCGDCWRAHRTIQEQRRRLDRIEAESLIEPESR